MLQWIVVCERLPEESGEYLVLFGHCSLPTMLYFDANVGQVFYDEDHSVYESVTHWMKIPVMIPGTSEPLSVEKAVLENKLEYSICFTPEEVIIYLDILRFLVNFYDLAEYLEVKLFSLMERFENVIGDN